MLTQGEYAGHQALILKPSSPFPFIGLPVDARTLVYQHYFAPEGKLDGKIEIGQANGGLSAKTYASEAKHRLALLMVNKEVSPTSKATDTQSG